jgi:LCP family protein required for cell wall assembly
MTPNTPQSNEPAALDRRKKRARARRRWAIFGLGSAAVAGAGLAMGMAGAGYLYASNTTVRSVINAVVHRDLTPDRAFPGQDSLTLHAIGADQDRDDYKRVVGKAQRSDTLMVLRFDFASQRASIVSIPRDTKIRIPGYRGYQKINAAFAYGGTDLAKKTVEGLLGVTADHAMVVNFDGFKKIVHLIGAGPVTVDTPLTTAANWCNLHVHLDPGDHWLNGEQALGYCRIRKVDSDLHRAERQQQFLQALKGRLADPRVWLKSSAIIAAARGSLDTDLTDAQLLCLGAFLKNLPKESVQTATLPGDEGRSFVTLYPDKVRDIARDLLAVQDAPLEGLGGRGIGRLAREDDGDGPRRLRRRRTRDEVSGAERNAWNVDRPAKHSKRKHRKNDEADAVTVPADNSDEKPANEAVPASEASSDSRPERTPSVRVREVPSEPSPSSDAPSHESHESKPSESVESNASSEADPPA